MIYREEIASAASSSSHEIRIVKVEPFLLHVPIGGQGIADSTHSVTHWGFPGVILHASNGLRGYGCTGTHAHLESDLLITGCIARIYAPLLAGESIHDVQRLWRKLYHFPPLQWVGRAGITQLALSAVDVALWDLKAKACGLPLWRFLGGLRPDGIPAYSTDAGWLSLGKQELVANCRRAIEVEGFKGVKIKVGLPDPGEDIARVEAVRQAIGPEAQLMVDANGCCTLPGAMELGRRFEDYNLTWFEEPLWYDDVEGHRRLAEAMRVPIALGEQLYSPDAFQAFVTSGAVHYLQPDATRVGGITGCWQVMEMAHAHRLPVAPHAGDMMQIHLQLALAHPSCAILEYIPWARRCFVEPATAVDGRFAPPQLPGAGTELLPQALEQFGIPLPG